MLKADVGTTSVALEGLFQWLWVKEEFTEDWLKGLIIKLPKKRDLKSCENWKVESEKESVEQDNY